MQIAGLLMGLRVRGETVPELVGAVRAMRSQMRPVPGVADAIDVCGTGGDGLGTTPHECVAAAVEGSSRLYGMLPKAGPLDMHDWCVVGAWVGASAAPPHVAREPFVGTATSRSSE